MRQDCAIELDGPLELIRSGLWAISTEKRVVSFSVINQYTQKKQNKIWKHRTYVSSEL